VSVRVNFSSQIYDPTPDVLLTGAAQWSGRLEIRWLNAVYKPSSTMSGGLMISRQSFWL